MTLKKKKKKKTHIFTTKDSKMYEKIYFVKESDQSGTFYTWNSLLFYVNFLVAMFGLGI